MHSRFMKNAFCVKYISESSMESLEFEKNVQKFAHRPIKPSQEQSIGFSPVFGYMAPKLFTHRLQEFIYVSLTIEKKKINAPKLKRLVMAAIKAKADETDIDIKDIPKDDKSKISDSVKQEYLKTLSADDEFLNAVLDTSSKLLMVDTGSVRFITNYEH